MVYLLLSDGFEEIEAITPVDIIRRSGIDIKTVGVQRRVQTGSHNIPVICDIEINEVNENDITMLILPGGPGHEILDASNEVHRLINYCIANGIYISSICAAPSILGKKGFLDGKSAVCYPGYEKYLYGAEVSENKTAVDGKYITGRGPGAAAEFAFEIVRILNGNDKKIKEMMCY